jgi:putative mRNA 3-end processing factor
MDLIVARPEGLYCPAGDFYIDPWRPVDRAVITHAHSDHARHGHRHYMAAAPGAGVLRARLGDIDLDAVPYGEARVHNGVRISLHPAGHVLGSAQVRLQHGGQVWVASGDYKLQEDGTCDPFEPVPCDVFITESTFGLPIYRWDEARAVHGEIEAWRAANAAQGRPSVLFCYAFGKAQRILHGLDATLGPIVAHGAVETLNRIYRASGVQLPPTATVADIKDPADLRRAIVLAPPSARGTAWMRRFGDHADAYASGWMRLRGARRRRGVDRGFVMSDHADWPGLRQAIAATGAKRVIVTHGSVAVLVRWLNEQGLQAEAFATEYGAEEDEGGADAAQGARRDSAREAPAGADDIGAAPPHEPGTGQERPGEGLSSSAEPPQENGKGRLP